MMVLLAVLSAIILVAATAVATRYAISSRSRGLIILAVSLGFFASIRTFAVTTFALGLRDADSVGMYPPDVLALIVSGVVLTATVWGGSAILSARRSERQHRLLSLMARDLASAKNIREAAFVGRSILPSILTFDRFILATFEDGHASTQEIFSWGSEDVNPEAAKLMDSELVQRVGASAMRGRVVTLESLDGVSPDYDWSKLVEMTGLTSGLVAPLFDAGEAIGMICFLSAQSASHDPEYLRVAYQVAEQYSGPVSNWRVRRKLERKSRESAVLARIGLEVGSSLEPTDVYQTVADHLHHIVKYDRFSICLFSANAGYLTTVFHRGITLPALDDSEEWRPAIFRYQDVIGPRLSFVFGESDLKAPPVQSDQAQQFLDAGLRSGLVAPLLVDGQPIGVVGLASELPDAYSDAETKMIEQIAGQIAPAIANSKLHLQLSRELSNRRVLTEIGRAVNSSLDFGEVFQALVNSARDLVSFDRLTVTDVNVETMQVETRYSHGVHIENCTPGRIAVLGITPVNERLLGGQGIAINTDPEAGGAELDAFNAGLRSAVMSPLVHEGKIVGVISARSLQPNMYGQRDVDLLDRIADRVAIAFVNAERHALTVEQSGERQMLADIGRLATSSLDVGTIYQRLVRPLSDVINFDRLAVTTYDSKAQTCTTRFAAGEVIEGSRVGDTRKTSMSLAEYVMKRNRPVVVSGRYDPPEIQALQIPGRTGMKSAIHVPIAASGEVMGLLTVRSWPVDAFDQRDSDLLRRVSEQIAGAVRNAELHERAAENAELDARNRELIAAAQARAGFLSSVSHELKTPLTSISAFTDILARNRGFNLTTRQTGQLAVIRRNVDRLAALIRDLLDVSRSEAGTFQLNIQNCDVTRIISEVTESLRPIVDAENQRIIEDTPDAPAEAECDRLRIGQVITNLISNASKYSDSGSLISVSLRTDQEDQVIEVSDAGIGMSASDIGQLFTPFFRADNERTRSRPGTGLGLVISRSIVELHGGSMTIESKPGQGTTATIRFPLAHPELVDVAADEETEPDGRNQPGISDQDFLEAA